MSELYDLWNLDPYQALSAEFEKAFDENHGISKRFKCLIGSYDITGKLILKESAVDEINLMYREYKVEYSRESDKLIILFTDVIYDHLSDKNISKLAFLMQGLDRGNSSS